MRRGSLFLVALVSLAAVLLNGVDAPPASGGVSPSCATAAVRVIEYNTSVGAGNVNDLFWIRNVSHQRCSIRGYVRIAYVGVYGLSVGKLSHVHALTVKVGNSRNGGLNGNDIGGVVTGPIPTVTLAPRAVASLWVYGTDEPSGAPPVRCITSYRMLVWLPGAKRSDVVTPLRSDGFYWCGGVEVHPVVAGESGTQPAKPLSYYFGTPD